MMKNKIFSNFVISSIVYTLIAIFILAYRIVPLEPTQYLQDKYELILASISLILAILAISASVFESIKYFLNKGKEKLTNNLLAYIIISILAASSYPLSKFTGTTQLSIINDYFYATLGFVININLIYVLTLAVVCLKDRALKEVLLTSSFLINLIIFQEQFNSYVYYQMIPTYIVLAYELCLLAYLQIQYIRNKENSLKEDNTSLSITRSSLIIFMLIPTEATVSYIYFGTTNVALTIAMVFFALIYIGEFIINIISLCYTKRNSEISSDHLFIYIICLTRCFFTFRIGESALSNILYLLYQVGLLLYIIISFVSLLKSNTDTTQTLNKKFYSSVLFIVSCFSLINLVTILIGGQFLPNDAYGITLVVFSSIVLVVKSIVSIVASSMILKNKYYQKRESNNIKIAKSN